MSKAVLKPNEFIVSVSEDSKYIHIRVRNPHIEPGNDGIYSAFALELVTKTVTLRAKKNSPKAYLPDEPDISDSLDDL